MLALLTAVNLLNYLDRWLLAALLPLIERSFGLSHFQSGVLSSAFVVGYCLFSPLFGYLGDRLSRPRLMALGVFVWSIATLLAGAATGFAMLLCARVLVGAGEASFGTVAPGFIRDRAGSFQAVNRSLSVFFAAIPVGAALGYVLGGFIGGHYSWGAAFFCGGIPGLLLTIFVARLRESNMSASSGTANGLQRILEERLLVIAILGYTLQTFALAGIASFVSTYGVSIGFGVDEIGTAFGLILVVTGFLGTYGGGRLCERLMVGARDPQAGALCYTAVSTMLAAPFVALAFSTTDRSVFLGCCFLAELLVFAGTAPLNTVIVQSAPAGLVTFTQGITILSINLLGYLPSPMLIGVVADQSGSLGTGMQLATIALLLAGTVWLRSKGSGTQRGSEDCQ